MEEPNGSENWFPLFNYFLLQKILRGIRFPLAGGKFQFTVKLFSLSYFVCQLLELLEEFIWNFWSGGCDLKLLEVLKVLILDRSICTKSFRSAFRRDLANLQV